MASRRHFLTARRPLRRYQADAPIALRPLPLLLLAIGLGSAIALLSGY